MNRGHGAVVARLICIAWLEKVEGSIPPVSTFFAKECRQSDTPAPKTVAAIQVGGRRRGRRRSVSAIASVSQRRNRCHQQTVMAEPSDAGGVCYGFYWR